MSGKVNKLIRKGAEKLKVSYNHAKKGYKRLNPKEKKQVLNDLQYVDYVRP